MSTEPRPAAVTPYALGAHARLAVASHYDGTPTQRAAAMLADSWDRGLVAAYLYAVTVDQARSRAGGW